MRGLWADTKCTYITILLLYFDVRGVGYPVLAACVGRHMGMHAPKASPYQGMCAQVHVSMPARACPAEKMRRTHLPPWLAWQA